MKQQQYPKKNWNIFLEVFRMISCWQTINAKELLPVRTDVKKGAKKIVREIVRQGKNPNKS